MIEHTESEVYSRVNSVGVLKISSTSLYDTNVKNPKWPFMFRRDIKYKKLLKSHYLKIKSYLNH